MATKRPTIGVTGPDGGGTAAWIFTKLAVAMAGGKAVRITPGRARSIDDLDGVIIGGGADVNPTLYGEEHIPFFPTHKLRDETLWQYLLDLIVFPLTWLSRKLDGLFTAAKIDGSRDTLELDLIRGAIERGLPVLGICRGEQLLNVCFGGTLHQRLTGFYTEDAEVRTILPRRRIIVAPGTRLASMLGASPRPVNALHRQAVHKIGSGLQVAAFDRNRIIQAIEHASLPFVIGVQWHPEYLPQVPEQRALFAKLVEEAGKRRQRSAPVALASVSEARATLNASS